MPTSPKSPAAQPTGTQPPPPSPATHGHHGSATPPGGIIRQTAGWLAGMLIVFCAGWGFLYLDWYLVKHYKLAGVNPGRTQVLTFLAAGLVLSFTLFMFLERKFWLSHLIGYKVYPDANPLPSALYYAVGGIPGMFARTAVGSPPKHANEKAPPQPAPGHAPREAIETIVFVVVLVFLLKQFVVEAFVIPTGSMAETLYGYQKIVTCAECGHEFPLNASIEVDPPPGVPKRPVEGYCCPNCRYKAVFGSRPPSTDSGDRVLVHKAIQHIHPPEPGDVVVFKYPADPQRYYSAQNYIKRLWGVGGDTIAIWRGDLYVCKTLDYPPADAKPGDLWQKEYTNQNAENALKKFEESRAQGFPVGKGGFELIRKSDDLALAMRRIVYDNDQQARYLIGKGVPPRWKRETDDWAADSATEPRAFTHTGAGLGWVRYRHLVPDDWHDLAGPKPAVEPRPVDNFLGYNAEVSPRGEFKLDSGAEDYKFWVGDLMLEARAAVTDPAAEVTLELSKGPNRYQAKFAGGTVTLVRTGPGGEQLGSWPTPVTGPGTYDLRFANIDCRLRVWVDGSPVPLGPAADYAPAVSELFDPKDEKKEGWTTANDMAAPASIGATGGVGVSHLKLWRDTYYINTRYSSTTNATATFNTYYVHPGHYLCLGDNSAQSSDGRDWGTVPERLMLGRAVFVFFPFDRIGFIK